VHRGCGVGENSSPNADGYRSQVVGASSVIRAAAELLIDPWNPPRAGVALRRFVARWLGPAMLYPRMVRSMDALNATAHIRHVPGQVKTAKPA
jgi:hypothetical protein